MLKRILETKDAIISTLALINAPVDALCQEEWELVNEVCTILQPFEEVTVEISADRYLEPLFFFLSTTIQSLLHIAETTQYNVPRIICHIL